MKPCYTPKVYTEHQNTTKKWGKIAGKIPDWSRGLTYLTESSDHGRSLRRMTALGTSDIGGIKVANALILIWKSLLPFAGSDGPSVLMKAARRL